MLLFITFVDFSFDSWFHYWSIIFYWEAIFRGSNNHGNLGCLGCGSAPMGQVCWFRSNFFLNYFLSWVSPLPLNDNSSNPICMWHDPGMLISWRWSFLLPRPQEMASFLTPSHNRWVEFIQSQFYSWVPLSARCWTGCKVPDGMLVLNPYLNCRGLWAIPASACTYLPGLNSFFF